MQRHLLAVSVFAEEQGYATLQANLKRELEEFSNHPSPCKGTPGPRGKLYGISSYRYDSRLQDIGVPPNDLQQPVIVRAELDVMTTDSDAAKKDLSQWVQTRLALPDEPQIDDVDDPFADPGVIPSPDEVPAGNRKIVRKAPPFVR